MSSAIEDLVAKVLTEAANKRVEHSACCGQTLARLFNNVLDNPGEPRFRKLNKHNKVLSERLFNINGVEELLLMVGWHSDGDTYVFPVEALLDSMRLAVSNLQCACGCQFLLSKPDLANQMLAGRREKDDWFACVFGFKEWTCLNVMKTRSVFSYDATSGVLESSACRGRQFVAGFFSTPSLEELTARADLDSARRWGGELRISKVVADVGQLHDADENRGAVFQAASQFNCLEHSGPAGRAEDGISRYANDRTQGPACALACAAGAVVRNYFAFDNKHGQTMDKQVNNLKDVEAVLCNEGDRFFQVRSGYTLATESGLAQLNKRLDGDESLEEQVRKKIRIGVQAGTEVLTSGNGRILRQSEPGQHLVTQTYCSAISVAYSGCSATSWERLARIVLEAAYEATLLVSIENALQNPEAPGARKVFLTGLGGGAFGNDQSWIENAMSKVLDKFKDIGLEVHLVSKTPMSLALGT